MRSSICNFFFNQARANFWRQTLEPNIDAGGKFLQNLRCNLTIYLQTKSELYSILLTLSADTKIIFVYLSVDNFYNSLLLIKIFIFLDGNSNDKNLQPSSKDCCRLRTGIVHFHFFLLLNWYIKFPPPIFENSYIAY